MQEAEKLTLENSKLIEENKDLHETVDVLQSKTQEMEASLEEKNTYLLKLADEMTKRDDTIKMNEELLTATNQKVCIHLLAFKTLVCVYVYTCIYMYVYVHRLCYWSNHWKNNLIHQKWRNYVKHEGVS